MKFEPSLNQSMSLVRIPAFISGDPELRHKYRQLALMNSSLRHPGIIEVKELLDDDCLVVESLREAHPVTCPPKEFGQSARELIDALEYAHRHGVCHQRLNCHCLWGFPNKELKVWGFGIDYLEERHGPAKIFEVSPSSAYCPPEHYLGRELDVRSDIWSLGIILYRWCTGHLPFASNSLPVLVDRIMSYHPAEPGSDYGDFILRCIEKNSDDRFQTMAEVSDYLNRRSP